VCSFFPIPLSLTFFSSCPAVPLLPLSASHPSLPAPITPAPLFHFLSTLPPLTVSGFQCPTVILPLSTLSSNLPLSFAILLRVKSVSSAFLDPSEPGSWFDKSTFNCSLSYLFLSRLSSLFHCPVSSSPVEFLLPFLSFTLCISFFSSSQNVYSSSSHFLPLRYPSSWYYFPLISHDFHLPCAIYPFLPVLKPLLLFCKVRLKYANNAEHNYLRELQRSCGHGFLLPQTLSTPSPPSPISLYLTCLYCLFFSLRSYLDSDMAATCHFLLNMFDLYCMTR